MRSFSGVDHLVVAFLVVLTGCGSDGSGGTVDSDGTGGLPGTGGVSPASGGTPYGAGGAAAGGGGIGAAGSPSSGGAATVALPGQLVCGAKQCHAGGACEPDGTCPPFLGSCFVNSDADTCDAQCASQGFACAMKFCNSDGSPNPGGYSWVSYTKDHTAECAAAAQPPDEMSFDACSSPIWLSPLKAADDIVRCCCRDR